MDIGGNMPEPRVAAFYLRWRAAEKTEDRAYCVRGQIAHHA